MAITVVGQGSAAATSVAIPAHAVGDMILVMARGTAAAPVIPAAGGTVPAWASLQSGLANSIGLTSAFFVATATNHTTGTWTSATHICVLVLRPGAGKLLSASAAKSSTGNGNNTQTIIYPALTVLTDGTSMGVRVGTRTVAITAVGTAPSGWTNQTIQPAGASALMSVHTRAALVANPTADTVTVTSSNAPYRAHTIEVQEVGAQTVTVNGKATSQAFGTVNILEGPVGVGGGGLGSAQTFGAVNTAKGPVSVQIGGVYPFGYTPTIVGTFLVGDGHLVGGASVGQYGTPVVQIVTGTAVTVSGKGSSQAFGTPTIRATFTRSVGSVGSAQSFGSLSFRVTLGSGGVLSAQAFGTVTPKAVITRAVTGLGSAQAFGMATLLGTTLRPVTGLGTAQSFGAVTTAKGPVTVAVTGKGTSQAFGSISTGGVSFASPASLGSAQNFGTVTTKAVITRTVTGLGSAQSFGAISTGAVTIKPVGSVPSAQVFGSLIIVKGTVSRAPGGVTSAQSFGTITTKLSKAALGVGTAQAFGAPNVQVKGPTQIVPVLGIQQVLGVQTIVGTFLVGDGHRVGRTGGLFGVPTVFTNQVQVVVGLGSAQQFGQVIPRNIVVVAGVASAGRFGTPTIHATITIPVGGVGSAQQFGAPWIAFDQFQDVLGLGSAQAFGEPFTYLVWVYPPGPPVEALLPPVVCDSVTLTPVACADESLDPVVWAEETLASSTEEDLVLTPSVET